jgi:hypothetical protein
MPSDHSRGVVANEQQAILEAASFAARAHRHKLRKDGQTPYAAHPFRVCLIVRHVVGIDDPGFLVAALLHDTIDDTTTDFDNLEELFWARVAQWVAAMSKDMRLPDAEREASYRPPWPRPSPRLRRPISPTFLTTSSTAGTYRAGPGGGRPSGRKSTWPPSK